MIYQTTKGIDKNIRKSGCYFLDLLRIFEIVSKYTLSVSEVNQVFKLCVRVGYIGGDGFIKEDAAKGISQVVSGLTGKHVYIKRVFEESQHNFLIGKYVWEDTHFILMPGPMNSEYDPWSADGSQTVKKGKFHSPRYFYAEAI